MTWIVPVSYYPSSARKLIQYVYDGTFSASVGYAMRHFWTGLRAEGLREQLEVYEQHMVIICRFLNYLKVTNVRIVRTPFLTRPFSIKCVAVVKKMA